MSCNTIIYEVADTKEGVESFLEKRPAEFPETVSRDLPSYYPWWDDREFS